MAKAGLQASLALLLRIASYCFLWHTVQNKKLDQSMHKSLTRAPALAAKYAAVRPAAPPPTTIKSGPAAEEARA